MLKKFFLITFLFVSAMLQADITGPLTTYSENEGYTTVGFVEFHGNRERAREIMADFEDYENWLLEGLRKDDPDAGKLTCTLNDLRYYPEEKTFKVSFSFNIFFLKHKEYTLPFLIKEIEYDESGKMKGIKLEADKTHKSNKFLEELVYTLSLEDDLILYTGKCRLKGLARAFFSLRLYKKNIEWYIFKFAENFINEF